MTLKASSITNPRHNSFFKLPLLALAGIFLIAMTRQPEPVSRLSRLEIVRDDSVMAVLEADAQGGILRLMDSQGHNLLSLGTDASGGPLLKLHAQNGTQVLTVKTSDDGFIITQQLGDKEYIFFDTEFDGRNNPDRLNTVKVIAGRLGDMNISIRDLQHRQKILADQMRDIRPHGRDSSIVERNRRTVQDLERQANARDRLIEQLRSDLNRRRTDLDELRRRIRDLERRRP